MLGLRVTSFREGLIRRGVRRRSVPSISQRAVFPHGMPGFSPGRSERSFIGLQESFAQDAGVIVVALLPKRFQSRDFHCEGHVASVVAQERDGDVGTEDVIESGLEFRTHAILRISTFRCLPDCGDSRHRFASRVDGGLERDQLMLSPGMGPIESTLI